MNEFPFTLEEVLLLNNVDYPAYKKKVRIKCPFCSKQKINKDMSINFERETFNCFKCGISGRGGTLFHAYLNKLTTKEAYSEILNRLNINTSDKFEPKKREVIEVEKPDEVEVPIADDITLNATHRNMIEIMSLTERDKQDLLDRGFTELEINSIGYVSYPSGDPNSIVQEYFDIPKKLLAKRCTLKGVPGFHKTKNKGVHTMAWRKAGTLVPCVSYHNNIVGFQLRKHDEELGVNEEGERENKYSWFSSPGKLEGCASVGRTHYACDFEWDVNNLCFSPIITNGTICFTEGYMKADLFHVLTGLPIIARPGCGILKDLDKDLLKLKEEKNVTTFVCLYDMDYITNPNVQNDIIKLENIVKECGMKYVRPVWNTNVNGNSILKGIDDYYAYIKRNIIPVKTVIK